MIDVPTKMDAPMPYPPSPHSPSDHEDPTLAIPDVLKDQPARATTGPSRPAPSQGSMAGLAGAGKAWGIALEFIATIMFGGGLGWLIDRWKHSASVGVLVGLALGFVVAFVRIVRTTQAQERADAARKRRDSHTP